MTYISHHLRVVVRNDGRADQVGARREVNDGGLDGGCAAIRAASPLILHGLVDGLGVVRLAVTLEVDQIS